MYRSMEEAVGLVQPTDTMAFPLGPGQPTSFLHALGERDDWVDLTLGGALLVDLYDLLKHPNVHMLSGFYGPAERFLIAEGADIQFVPADFRRFAPVLERQAPRIMATAATPPDADGWCSLSLHVGATGRELERAAADPDRILVVEANEQLPRTLGLPPEHPHRLHVDQIDVLIEGDRHPVTIDDPPPTDVERAIAEHMVAFVEDGCTLQTGIGGVPSLVASLLAERDGGDYGIHSEMFTTGLMRLHQAGKVTNRKGIFDGFSVTTFCLGTAELYEWLDGNEEVRFLPVDIVNSPDVIARNNKVVSVNGALAIDLYGQVVADTIAGDQYTGIGGHEDFVAASGLELEDRSLICMPSTARTPAGLVSRILPTLPSGSVVTTPRHQVDVVVTEYGVAELRGGTVRERALALAQIAAPDARDELIEAAEQMR